MEVGRWNIEARRGVRHPGRAAPETRRRPTEPGGHICGKSPGWVVYRWARTVEPPGFNSAETQLRLQGQHLSQARSNASGLRGRHAAPLRAQREPVSIQAAT